MNVNTWFWIAAGIFGSLSAAFALFAAGFDYLQDFYEGDTRATRAWFRARFGAVDGSAWLDMPERVISWMLRLKDMRTQEYVRELITGSERRGIYLFFPSIVLSSSFGAWLHWHEWRIAAIATVIAIVFWSAITKLINRIPPVGPLPHVAAVVLMAALLFTAYVSLWSVLHASIRFAGLLVLILLPCLAVALATSAVAICLLFQWLQRSSTKQEPRYSDTTAGVVGYAVSISVAMTVAALFLGYVADPKAWIPKTAQMLCSNVLFDALTIYVTLCLLSSAISRPGILRIPRAIIVDLACAGLFSFCSLYFGLAFTNRVLSPAELMHTFVARSLSGDRWEFGPYFWVMHTTFLPMAAYLVVVLFCWTVKASLIPVRKHLEKAKTHKEPMKFTGHLCGVYAKLFAGLALASGLLLQYYKDIDVPPEAQYPPSIAATPQPKHAKPGQQLAKKPTRPSKIPCRP